MIAKLSSHLHPSLDNLRTFADFVGTLKTDRAVAFVGAGVSVEAGYPTWTQLLSQLHAKLGELQVSASPRELQQILRMNDPLWRAEEYRRLLDRTAFSALMWEFFRPRPAVEAPTAGALAGLPFRHYLTTNYDPLLETECRKRHEGLKVTDWTQSEDIQRFLRTMHLKDTTRHLVYLHGRYDRPESIVLSERDYVRRYVASDETPRKLFTLFATQRVVFVGFSLNDPDLTFVLRSVNAAFGALEAQHFLLAPIGDDEDESVERRKFSGKHGVAPIFFRKEPAKPFAALPRILTGVAKLLGDWKDGGIGIEELTERVFASSRSVSTKRRKTDPDDPHKGFAGGKATSAGVRLSGRVKPTEELDWFEIKLEVQATTAKARLGRYVEFYLHPTFHPAKERVTVKNGKAVWTGHAYGAFTVGVRTAAGTRLELDLAELPAGDAPKKFRER